MNTDRRIVPEKHVSSVLAEEHIGERTAEIKNTLKESGNKLDNVAHKWIEHGGMNPLARVMMKNVHGVPQKKSQTPVHNALGHEAHHGHDAHGHGHEAHHGHDAHGHGHEAHHGHDAHGHGHEAHHGHDAHGHGHEAHHGHDAHGHGHEAHHGHDAHGHGHEAHHGHDAHGHGHEAHHGHDAHGHGHEAHHGHEHKSGMASFVSTGHWYGERGQHIFGLFGRLLGEIVGYCARLFVISILFGPTRTALLIVVVGYIINTLTQTELPILGLGIAGLLIHLIFYAIGQIGGGGGEHGGGHGGGSEHGGHGHH